MDSIQHFCLRKEQTEKTGISVKAAAKLPASAMDEHAEPVVTNPACKGQQAVTCAGGGTPVCRSLRSTTALYKSPSGESTHLKTC